MKTTLKITACLVLFCAATTVFGQTKSDAPGTTKTTKKQKSKKEKSAIDNKIAVSDQAQPTEKGSKASKKDNGISNK